MDDIVDVMDSILDCFLDDVDVGLADIVDVVLDLVVVNWILS